MRGQGIEFEVAAGVRPQHAAVFMHENSLERAELTHTVRIQGADVATPAEWVFIVGCRRNQELQILSEDPADPVIVKRDFLQALKDSYQFYEVELPSLTITDVVAAANEVISTVLEPALTEFLNNPARTTSVQSAVIEAMREYRLCPTVVDSETRDLHGLISNLVVNRALTLRGYQTEVDALRKGAFRLWQDGEPYRLLSAAIDTQKTSVRHLCSPTLAKLPESPGHALGLLDLNQHHEVRRFFNLCLLQVVITVEALARRCSWSGITDQAQLMQLVGAINERVTGSGYPQGTRGSN